MSRWYRAYEGTCTDPKLAEAAMVAGCSRSVAIATWHMILEDAARTNDSGRFEIPPRRIAAALCEPLDVLEALFVGLASTGIIADAHVPAWKRRQYESDNSTARARKSRAKSKASDECNGDATLPQRCATPPKTETELPLPNGNGRDASAVDLAKAIFDSGVSILTAAGHSERQARTMIGRWRKDNGDGAILTVLAKCQVENASDPIAYINANIRTGSPANDHRPRNSSTASAAEIARQHLGC